ncbi:alpha/beta hydrolase family protein [Cladophialophora carrionii]|uniref:Alpha/beta hydrolase family protein n=1 Tax=Cladophialophora carrionii TaxID=86049 RepID=A0A1C1CE20_9EURO|nr:alpha/beta hydrolase family protein [Cladophialophora carrionii]
MIDEIRPFGLRSNMLDGSPALLSTLPTMTTWAGFERNMAYKAGRIRRDAASVVGKEFHVEVTTLLPELTSSAVSTISLKMTRFQDWETQLVPTANGRIFFRYAGKGQPILLLHGVPQHSLMYHSIAPALVSKGFLAIVPDLPGFGQSIVNKGTALTSKNAADALHTVIKFLDLKELHLFAFDKGTGPAIVLARDYPDIIKGLIIAEYSLPGFGHEIAQQPSRVQTIFDHWHLGLFTLPEVAVFLIRGREEEFLTWYYWHTSYSGHN